MKMLKCLGLFLVHDNLFRKNWVFLPKKRKKKEISARLSLWTWVQPQLSWPTWPSPWLPICAGLKGWDDCQKCQRSLSMWWLWKSSTSHQWPVSRRWVSLVRCLLGGTEGPCTNAVWLSSGGWWWGYKQTCGTYRSNGGKSLFFLWGWGDIATSLHLERTKEFSFPFRLYSCVTLEALDFSELRF